ncbi:hypothetical protein [Tropicimonas sp. IMCC6043]|uniref:hypothetical protein n=1 Tax=Tropicimonas sp. IMCC6043 TaxID=2510645 RepID=UPI00101CE48E|nr:hypothetical protein [Tropicimonas sp. IMCC6043]RYH06461.1 hypothetical protein EU800_23710 [Tropicimonas sp. IMCC6043]
MMAFVHFVVVTAIVFAALRFGFGPRVMGREAAEETVLAEALPVPPLSWVLGAFHAATQFTCVALDLLFPRYTMNPARAPIRLGFVWLTPLSFLIGLVESFFHGRHLALDLGGLNVAVSRRAAT